MYPKRLIKAFLLNISVPSIFNFLIFFLNGTKIDEKSHTVTTEKYKNVLFIVADDLGLLKLVQ
jgi:hypothetical protein